MDQGRWAFLSAGLKYCFSEFLLNYSLSYFLSWNIYGSHTAPERTCSLCFTFCRECFTSFWLFYIAFERIFLLFWSLQGWGKELHFSDTIFTSYKAQQLAVREADPPTRVRIQPYDCHPNSDWAKGTHGSPSQGRSWSRMKYLLGLPGTSHL